MSNIKENLQTITASLTNGVKLIAVSKFQAISSLQEAYDAGQRRFGENRVQEMCQKQEFLPKDIEWHFIGHLQKNKIKYIVPFVSCIHSIDSIALLEEVNKEAEKVHRVLPCLLQVHIAQEQSKFGFSVEDCLAYLQSSAWKSLRHIRIDGLMGMATFTDCQEQVRKEFQTLRHCFEKAKKEVFPQDVHFCELSMGMSQDYSIAMEEGSTMVRIGTSLFGVRL